jgi:predicted DNA repair protein MutK
MVIALKEVLDESVFRRAIILVVVAVLITVIVYGVVALIVKMDDIGLSLAQRESETAQRVGLLLVRGMPKLLTVLSVVGTAAMLWVGGHIIIVGLHELGWDLPYDIVHDLEEAVSDVPGIGGLLGWLVNTALSALVGLIVGLAVMVAVKRLPFGKDDHAVEAAH